MHPHRPRHAGRRFESQVLDHDHGKCNEIRMIVPRIDRHSMTGPWPSQQNRHRGNFAPCLGGYGFQSPFPRRRLTDPGAPHGVSKRSARRRDQPPHVPVRLEARRSVMSHITHLMQFNPPSKIFRGSSADDHGRQQANKFPHRVSHRLDQPGLVLV